MQLLEGEMPFTVVLDDPLANSYIQNVYAPDEDPNMVVEVRHSLLLHPTCG